MIEYRKVLELSPDYSWAYFNIAQIYFELNRIDDCVMMLNKAIEKNPNDIESYKLLIQIMIKQGKIDESLEYLTQLLQKHQSGDLYYLMSRIFEINEDIPSQKDCLSLALDFKESLTFNHDAVKNELKELKEKIDAKQKR